MTSDYPSNETMDRIGEEVARSRTKYPGNEHMLAALQESLGTLAEALLCSWSTRTIGDNPADTTVRTEATKVAAIAIRIVEEGDVTFQQWKRKPVLPSRA